MSALDLARSDWQLKEIAAVDWVKLSLQLALGGATARSRGASFDQFETELDMAIVTGDNAAALRVIESFRSEAPR